MPIDPFAALNAMLRAQAARSSGAAVAADPPAERHESQPSEPDDEDPAFTRGS
ncbi:hypothetical protein [Streptomyces hypolithicus]